MRPRGLCGRRGERGLVVVGAEIVGDAALVVESDEVTQLREVGPDVCDHRTELGLVHDCREIGIVEQVAQLLFDVAVVHVDRRDARFEAADHRLEPFGAVVRIDADPRSRFDAGRTEMVRETRGALVELCERQPAVAGNERETVRHVTGNQLEKIGQVHLHGGGC